MSVPLPPTKALKSLTVEDLASCGREALDLSILASQGLPVPPTFVIPNTLLHDVLLQTGLAARMGADLPGVRRTLLSVKFSKPIREEIAERYESLTLSTATDASGLIASVGEPVVTFIFSGEDATSLPSLFNIRGTDYLLESLKRAWARSLPTVLPAIIVQQLPWYDATLEATLDPDTVTIQGYFGLPDLDGSIEKDTYLLDQESRTLKDVQIRMQDHRLLPDPDTAGSLEKTGLGPRSRAQKIPESVLREAARLTMDASTAFETPLRLTFLLKGERLVLHRVRRQAPKDALSVAPAPTPVPQQSVPASSSLPRPLSRSRIIILDDTPEPAPSPRPAPPTEPSPPPTSLPAAPVPSPSLPPPKETLAAPSPPVVPVNEDFLMPLPPALEEPVAPVEDSLFTAYHPVVEKTEEHDEAEEHRASTTFLLKTVHDLTTFLARRLPRAKGGAPDQEALLDLLDSLDDIPITREDAAALFAAADHAHAKRTLADEDLGRAWRVSKLLEKRR